MLTRHTRFSSGLSSEASVLSYPQTNPSSSQNTASETNPQLVPSHTLTSPPSSLWMLQDLAANLALEAMQDSALLNTNPNLTKASGLYLAENWKKEKKKRKLFNPICM